MCWTVRNKAAIRCAATWDGEPVELAGLGEAHSGVDGGQHVREASGHDQRSVPMGRVPGADLVFIEPAADFGLLVRPFDRPVGSGQGDQGAEAHRFGGQQR